MTAAEVIRRAKLEKFRTLCEEIGALAAALQRLKDEANDMAFELQQEK